MPSCFADLANARINIGEKDGGDDETRTRDFCRDGARFPSPAPDSRELTRRRGFPFFKTTIFLSNFMGTNVVERNLSGVPIRDGQMKNAPSVDEWSSGLPACSMMLIEFPLATAELGVK
jgi:hypothetical protein